MAAAPRPPIVAVMGHIDHGKSSLLDYIRKANVTAGEAGGITQHVSAYEAVHPYEGADRTITFLDTPGHEAFRALRSRGAAVADVAILVIAAEEGVKPQTVEAYQAIEESGIPFVVAFTKMDKPGADLERAKISILETGIYLEGLGGSVPFAGVSSKTGEGIPELLDLVLLTADLAELTGDPSLPGEGFVLESSQDPKRGISATLILKNGSMAPNSVVVAGTAFAPVRFIEDFKGARLPIANPSQPIRISGWGELPAAGTPFTTVKTRKEAEKLVGGGKATGIARGESLGDVTGKVTLPVLLKADVTGSLEAIRHELSKLSHERVVIRIVDEGVGGVGEADVKSAHAGGAIVIAFNTPVDSTARDMADRLLVSIETFSIIYDLEKRVAELLAERSPRVTSEEVMGEAKVLKTFNATGTKQVMGAKWISGELSLNDMVKIDRRGVDLGRGKLTNLQVARADVQTIKGEGEFGLQVESKADIGPGDTLIAYRLVTT